MTESSGLPVQKSGCSNCVMRGLGLCTVLIDLGWEKPYAVGQEPIPQKKEPFAARRTIFHPNETLDGVPVICNGWATSIMKLSNGRRQILSILLPGELVTCRLLFERKLHLSIDAITRGCYRTFDQAQLRAAMTMSPNIFDTLLSAYNDERNRADHLIVDLGRRTATGRMAAAMQLSLGQRVGITFSFLLAVIGVLGWAAWSPAAAAQMGLNSWLGGFAAAAMVQAATCWYFLVAKIVNPMNVLIHSTQAMAGGDLTGSFETDRADEVGQLMRALYQLNTNLHSILGDIRSNFGDMLSATGDLASGNTDLSERTDTQAATLEETAASMEELTSTVKLNADRSTQGTQAAGNALAIADKGGQIMTKIVSTIADISESSNKITDIVGIINGIASQTNLLALNAAVEAARAGEAGRGFAVVATEVRSLAQRSAEAAKEIKQLIDNSTEKVQTGTVLASEAGTTMRDIIASVNSVTAIIKDIAMASVEQSTGISQVNDAVTQMDEVTQRNASLVQQTTAATGGLNNQGTKLMAALSTFKLKGHSRLAAAVRAPAARAATARRLRTAT